MFKRILFVAILFVFGLRPVKAQYELLQKNSIQTLLTRHQNLPGSVRTDLELELLTRTLPESARFDSLKTDLLIRTEASRDRNEICRINLAIARLYERSGERYEHFMRAGPFIDQADLVAKENGTDLYKAGVLVLRAGLNLKLNQQQSALECSTQAIEIALTTANDSLIAVTYSNLSYAEAYLDNSLSRLQALLKARTYAEKTGHSRLMARTLLDLAVFYQDASQMEISRDYYFQVLAAAEKAGIWTFAVEARCGIAMTYRLQHRRELAVIYYRSAIFQSRKYRLEETEMNSTVELLNYYINEETPDRGLAFLAANPRLLEYTKQIGLDYQINKLYALKFQYSGNYDSALFYVNKGVNAELGQTKNFPEKFEFSRIWARILFQHGQKQASLVHFLKAKLYADSAADLQKQKTISLDLDSTYFSLKDYKLALEHQTRYILLQDSLRTMGQEKDLMNAELADAEKRTEGAKKKKEESLRRRDSLEYMGITIAIACLFMILIILGVFRKMMSAIRALNFLTFIFLFEFITLLLDTQIHELTNGEPWKVLSIKIFS